MGRDYFKHFVDEYVAGISAIDPELTAENLYKPNLQLPAMSANTTLVAVEASEDGNTLLLHMTMPQELHVTRGAPSKLSAVLQCSGNSIDYTLRWYNKTATHVPETIWLSNHQKEPVSVDVRKLGIPIDALDANLPADDCKRMTCGVHLHGVSDKPSLELKLMSNHSLSVSSLDASLLSVGTADPVPTPLRLPVLSDGFHFALVGNIWNTNYPFWYPFEVADHSSQFRFQYKFD